MRALVTGATGFIGRRLVAELARKGAEVSCLVRPTSDLRPLRSLPLSFVQGDVTQERTLPKAVSGQDVVFHLAGLIRGLDERAFEAVNVTGTRHLIEACLHASPRPKRFVLVSSVAAAGPSPAGRPLTEDDEPRPVSAYGRTKLAAERIALEAGTALTVAVVRPPNVIGPGSPEILAALRLLRWGLLPAFGKNGPLTSLVDLDDLVSALVMVAEDPRAAGRTYFITDGKTYAWSEIASALAEEAGRRRFVRVPFGVQLLAATLSEIAARALGRPPALSREIVRSARVHSWVYDSSRIRRELGFRPAFGLRDSLRKAVEAFRSASRARPAPTEGRA